MQGSQGVKRLDMRKVRYLYSSLLSFFLSEGTGMARPGLLGRRFGRSFLAWRVDLLLRGLRLVVYKVRLPRERTRFRIRSTIALFCMRRLRSGLCRFAYLWRRVMGYCCSSASFGCIGRWGIVGNWHVKNQAGGEQRVQVVLDLYLWIR